MKLDITNADCIKEQKNLTNTTYYNVCDGTQTSVAVGSVDVLFGATILVVFIMFGVFLFKVIKEI